MRHQAWNMVPTSSARLSVHGGTWWAASPLAAANLLNPPSTPQIAAVRSAVGPLSAAGNGSWLPGR